MSAHPQGGQYDDGYGHGQANNAHGQNAYYHDDQYHDDAGRGQNQHGDAYYDESYVLCLVVPRSSQN